MKRTREAARGGAGARGRAAGREEGRRPERVAAEMQRVLSELLLRRSKDPRLQAVAVTRVALTPDLRHARVAYSLFGEHERRSVQEALDHATPFLRRGVAEALAMRYVPDLAFRYDEALEGARRIDDLLSSLRVSAEASQPGAEPGAEQGEGLEEGPPSKGGTGEEPGP